MPNLCCVVRGSTQILLPKCINFRSAAVFSSSAAPSLTKSSLQAAKRSQSGAAIPRDDDDTDGDDDNQHSNCRSNSANNKKKVSRMVFSFDYVAMTKLLSFVVPMNFVSYSLIT